MAKHTFYAEIFFFFLQCVIYFFSLFYQLMMLEKLRQK